MIDAFSLPCTIWTIVHKGLVRLLKISIDLDDDSPPFAQLVIQMRQSVERGRISPLDQLPSIRQLANDLGLNHNTVAKAYRQLERDRIIETKGYRGTFVHREAIENAKLDMRAVAEQRLSDFVSEFRRVGLTDSELRTAFANALRN